MRVGIVNWGNSAKQRANQRSWREARGVIKPHGVIMHDLHHIYLF